MVSKLCVGTSDEIIFKPMHIQQSINKFVIFPLFSNTTLRGLRIVQIPGSHKRVDSKIRLRVYLSTYHYLISNGLL